MTAIKALIFDFGNVLCTWTPPKDSTISPKKLKQIMSSDIWHDYERGRYLTAEECYVAIEKRFNVQAGDLDSAMAQARSSLQTAGMTLEFLTNFLRKHETLRLYGLTNTPRPEEGSVLSIAQQWPIFDEIYTSGSLGMRKPDICCYQSVLNDIDLPADAVLFVDDSQENILAAQSIGMRSILFQSHEQLCCQIENSFGNPVNRGQGFLKSNAKTLDSVTDTGIPIHDNFAQLLILDLTGNEELVQLEKWDRTWNYFIGMGTSVIGTPLLTTETFPNDLDTTSIALSTLPIKESIVLSVMDEMLTFTSEDGILMTYFDKSRPRVDPVVCVNALHLFCKYGREKDVMPTLEWVLKVLRNRAYIAGSRYYSSPDVFLYFLSRLSRVLRDENRRLELLSLLKQHVSERMGLAGDTVSLATRLLACGRLNLESPRDLSSLLSSQNSDGSWPIGWIYKYGSSGLEIGNRGLSTALAIKAIEACRVENDVIDSSVELPWASSAWSYWKKMWEVMPVLSRIGLSA
ncbi:hypothetical protein N7507_001975 [Penicillium longicatenatum]|nr:hypothetical protein N7507_001975 [Penicillium longicatenatum]